VLNEDEFGKLDFVNALTLTEDAYNYHSVDLIINIDSFQEMPPETIKYYLSRIINYARFFYSKNAVGKYRPESVGL
jgi:hypothetical protein